MGLSSTMETTIRCVDCGKYLKQTEEYFYKVQCSNCVARELEEHIKENKWIGTILK